MNRSRNSSPSPSRYSFKQAAHLGFYIGSGVGLAAGTAIAVWLGHNLIWQTMGLIAGASLGVCCGAAFVWIQRRVKPATAPVYRPTGS
ncbi:hypothetical protein GC197_12245 [bacterium]|nr:hypothetical protein [bacterium]